MIFEPDRDLLELKKKAKTNYRDLASIVQLSPSSVAQRFCGFQRWLPGERGRVMQFLRSKIEESPSTDSTPGEAK